MRFVRELEPTVRGQQICLIELDGNYYAVSSIPAAPDHGGPETLAFGADEDGEVSDYADLAGGRGMTREETIAQLESRGESPYASEVTDLMSAARVVAFPPDDSYYVDGGRA